MRKISNSTLLIFIISFINLSTLSAQNCLISVPSGVYNACPGNPTYLEFTIGGGVTVGPTYEYYYRIDGAGPYMVVGSNPYTIPITQAGTYVLTECNDLGSGFPIGINAGYDTETISSLPIPSVSITPDPANTSKNTDLILSSNTSGGTIPYATTTWIDGEGNVNPTNLQNTIFNSPASGSYVVTYQVTDDNGCIGTDNVNVTVINLQASIVTPADPADVCASNALALDGEALNGSGNYTYSWSYSSGGTGTFSNATAEDPTFTPNSADTYTLTFTVIDVGVIPNVSASTTLTVNSYTTPLDKNIIVTHYCDPDPGTITVESSEAGIEYELFDGVDAISTKVGDGMDLVWYLPPSANYNIIATNTVALCTRTFAGEYVVGNYTKPTVAPTVDLATICEGTSTTLHANAAGTGGSVIVDYLWDNAATLTPSSTMADPMVMPVALGSTTYTVTATDDKGCFITGNVDLAVNSVPVIDVFDSSPRTIDCNNPTVTLSADATALLTKTIVWTTTDGNIIAGANSPNPVVDQAGTYVVAITNTTNSCSTVRSVTIDENTTPPAIVIDVPLDLTCSISQVSLFANGTSNDASPVTYLWTHGAGGSIVSGISTATAVVDAVADYTVTVTDLGNGCTNTSTVSTTEDVTPPDISVDTSPDQITCDNATVILNGSSTYPNVSYKWTTSGSGTIFNAYTRTPSVNAIGTYNLVVKNMYNNCEATSDDVIVTEDKVVPTVMVNAPSGDLSCAITEVNVSVSQNIDYSYSWSGPGNIITPNTYSTNVEAAGTYTVSVEDIYNGCANSYTIDVIEDLTLDASPVINDIETCFGTANPSFTVISGTNVKWYDDAGLTMFLSTGNSYTPTATSVGIHIFYATSTGANGCESLPREIILTVHALPEAPLTIGNAICEGGAVQELTAIGTNINWYDSISVFQGAGSMYVPGDLLAGTYTYNATQTDAEGCESAQAEAIYTINTVPAQPVFINPNIENCETITNPIFNVIGSSIQWYKTIGGAVISMGNTHQPNEIIPGTYTYYATQTVSGCESPEATGNFTIKTIPIVYNVIGGGLYCEDGAGVDVSLSNSETGVNYELWLDDVTLITDMPGTTGSAISFGNQTLEGNYTVYAYNAVSLCKNKMNSSVDVSIDPKPGDVPTINGSAEVCQNETGVSYRVDPISDATNYVWTVPAGFTIVSGSNSNSITVNVDNIAISGNITVYAENACGVGTTSPILFVTVNPIPSLATNLMGPTTICNDVDGVMYSIDADAVATHYNWTLPQGATIVAGANSRQVILNFDQTAVNDAIIVAAANACGEGTSASQNIAVNDLPYVFAGDQQNLCIDNTVLEANTPAALSTGIWTIFNGAVTFPNNDDDNPVADITNIGEGNNRLVWTVIDVNGCTLSDTVIIANNIVNVDAGNNLVTCEESIVLAGSDAPIGAIGSWSVITGAANFSDRNSPTPIASGFAPGINILKWSVTKGGCTNYDTLIIDNQRPTQAYAGIDLSICGDSTALNANNPIIGEGTWSVINGAAIFENDKLFNTNINGLSQGDNILRWTISNGICSISDEVTVVNNQINVNAGVDQTICGNTTILDAVEFVSGTGYWSVISGAAVFDDVEDPNTVVFFLSQGTNVLTWNINNNNCISSDTVKITNDLPTEAYAGKDTTITTDIISLQGNIPTEGIGGWSLISGSCIIDNPLQNNTTVSSLGLGENIFRWTVTKNSCFSTDDVIITKTDLELLHAGFDQTLCSDVTYLDGNEPISGYGEWSVVLGSAIFADKGNPKTEVTGLAKGENILRWTISNGISSISDEVTVTNNLPKLSIDIPDDLTCNNTTVMLHANAENVSYNWTYNSPANIIGADTIANPIVNQPGTYILTVTDTIKTCAITDSVTVLQGEVLNPGICMLSVDSLNHNVIIWNQINDLVYDSIFIYKETSDANNYAKIGSQSAKDISLYEDRESSSAQNSSRYKISVVDTCGLETTLSEHHKTIHLTINLGLNGERNLIWNPYEGFEYSTFNIYRGTNNRDFVMIAQQVSNTFTYTDLNHAGGKNYYQIEIVNPNPCNVDNLKSAKSYYESTKSNIVSTEEVTSIFNLKMEGISIYPNPANNKIYIKSEIFTEDIFVSILTIDGKLIKTEGTINSNTEIDISNLNVGMYVLRLNFNNNLIHKKFIKQ